jgi:hypothetical protein
MRFIIKLEAILVAPYACHSKSTSMDDSSTSHGSGIVGVKLDKHVTIIHKLSIYGNSGTAVVSKFQAS